MDRGLREFWEKLRKQLGDENIPSFEITLRESGLKGLRDSRVYPVGEPLTEEVVSQFLKGTL